MLDEGARGAIRTRLAKIATSEGGGSVDSGEGVSSPFILWSYDMPCAQLLWREE